MIQVAVGLTSDPAGGSTTYPRSWQLCNQVICARVDPNGMQSCLVVRPGVPRLLPEERPFGMAHYLEALQHKTGTAHAAQQADPYMGIMLRGRRGVGKKLLTKVFAGSIGAG